MSTKQLLMTAPSSRQSRRETAGDVPSARHSRRETAADVPSSRREAAADVPSTRHSDAAMPSSRRRRADPVVATPSSRHHRRESDAHTNRDPEERSSHRGHYGTLLAPSSKRPFSAWDTNSPTAPAPSSSLKKRSSGLPEGLDEPLRRMREIGKQMEIEARTARTGLEVLAAEGDLDDERHVQKIYSAARSEAERLVKLVREAAWDFEKAALQLPWTR